MKAASARVLLAICLYAGAMFLPHPQGIWYFGHRPQWTIGIDADGLTIGRYPDLLLRSWIPLVALKLIVIAVPPWLAWRFWARRRRGHSAAG